MFVLNSFMLVTQREPSLQQNMGLRITTTLLNKKMYYLFMSCFFVIPPNHGRILAFEGGGGEGVLFRAKI